LWGGKNVVYLFGYKQGKMTKQRKKRALVPDYLSPNQLTLEGFETPFEQSLNPKNRVGRLGKSDSMGMRYAIFTSSMLG
jgi:hypothetical protein